MGKITSEEVLNSFHFYNRCLQLLKIPLRTTKNEIATFTEDLITNINFLNLLVFLEEEGYFIIDRTRTPHFYLIEKKRLAEFLRESKFFSDFGKIIELTKSVYSY